MAAGKSLTFCDLVCLCFLRPHGILCLSTSALGPHLPKDTAGAGSGIVCLISFGHGASQKLLSNMAAASKNKTRGTVVSKVLGIFNWNNRKRMSGEGPMR